MRLRNIEWREGHRTFGAWLGEARVGEVAVMGGDFIARTFLPASWRREERYSRLSDAQARVELEVKDWFEGVSQ